MWLWAAEREREGGSLAAAAQVNCNYIGWHVAEAAAAAAAKAVKRSLNT